jgi:hypothetical protein
MLCKGLMLSASLGLALVSADRARADICFQYNSGGGVVIALGAKVPATPDTCERVTAVSPQGGGVATGSICLSRGNLSTPHNSNLVYQYSFTGCSNIYFESATCHILLDDNFQLPTQYPGSQRTSCSGVVAHMLPGQSSPLGGFSRKDDLKAWNCTAEPGTVVAGYYSCSPFPPFPGITGASQGTGPTPQYPGQKE